MRDSQKCLILVGHWCNFCSFILRHQRHQYHFQSQCVFPTIATPHLAGTIFLRHRVDGQNSCTSWGWWVFSIIYKVLYTSQGWLAGFLNHQQVGPFVVPAVHRFRPTNLDFEIKKLRPFFFWGGEIVLIWMVYNGKPYWSGWFGEKPTIFGNIHIFGDPPIFETNPRMVTCLTPHEKPTASKVRPPHSDDLMTQEMSSARVGSSSNQTLDLLFGVSGQFFLPLWIPLNHPLMILDYTISPPLPHHPWIVKVSSLDFRNLYNRLERFWTSRFEIQGGGVPKPSKTSMCSSHRQLDPFIDVFSPFSLGGP